MRYVRVSAVENEAAMPEVITLRAEIRFDKFPSDVAKRAPG
jgi:hypothetical protein